MNVTIEDVAKKSGLSVVTVSRYINGASSVREYNRQRIQKAMDELNYTPSAAARTLSRGKTGIIGLLISHISDYYINKIIYSISKSLSEKKAHLALSVIEEESKADESYFLERDRVDGIIIFSSYLSENEIKKIKTQRIPAVIINALKPVPEFFSVASDDFCGGILVAEHLIRSGHKKIAHITGPAGRISSERREAGFISRLTDYGIPPFDVCRGAYSVRSGYECAERWIQNKKIPTAVFAADDQTAFGVMDAFRTYGIRIPEDVSVVGYDDHPFSADFHPGLTSVRQPAEKIGRRTVELLYKQIDEHVSDSDEVMIKPELIVRGSTRDIDK